MKNFKHITLLLFLFFGLILVMGLQPINNIEQITKQQNQIVVLKFKTQPQKRDLAIAELKKLFKKVKKEPHFVSIKMHVDSNDETNIMLYEEWEDLSYYNSEHMQTSHILTFMENSKNFLAGPPDISFWDLKHSVD